MRFHMETAELQVQEITVILVAIEIRNNWRKGSENALDTLQLELPALMEFLSQMFNTDDFMDTC